MSHIFWIEIDLRKDSIQDYCCFLGVPCKTCGHIKKSSEKKDQVNPLETNMFFHTQFKIARLFDNLEQCSECECPKFLDLAFRQKGSCETASVSMSVGQNIS